MTEDEMIRWHHQLNGYEFQQTLGDGEGQGSLECCSPWGHEKSDTTEQWNDNNRQENRKVEEKQFSLSYTYPGEVSGFQK